jgi:type I restriction enzyme M protein
MARTRQVNGCGELGFNAKPWGAVDALRSNMDAPGSKHAALSHISLKNVSDTFEARHAALVPQRPQGANSSALGARQ